MSYFSICKYDDELYQIKDALGSLISVIIGKDKALVLDTGYGIGNIYEEVRKITNLPLLIIDSHGHMDHTGGNYLFKEVYIHSQDLALVKKHNSLKWRMRNIESAKNAKVLPDNFNEEDYLEKREGNLLFLDDIKNFDLGGKTLEVIHTPGHTAGSISLYCKEKKIMITSDAICQYVWLFLEESTSVREYISSVEKVLEYDFDYFLVGHGARLIEKDVMKEYLACALSLDLSKAKKVTFKNFEECDSYEYSTDYLYSPKGCGVVFDINKVK